MHFSQVTVMYIVGMGQLEPGTGTKFSYITEITGTLYSKTGLWKQHERVVCTFSIHYILKLYEMWYVHSSAEWFRHQLIVLSMFTQLSNNNDSGLMSVLCIRTVVSIKLKLYPWLTASSSLVTNQEVCSLVTMVPSLDCQIHRSGSLDTVVDTGAGDVMDEIIVMWMQ